MKYLQQIKENILRVKMAGLQGGMIELSLSFLGQGYEGKVVAIYQIGILQKIKIIATCQLSQEANQVALELKQYFENLKKSDVFLN